MLLGSLIFTLLREMKPRTFPGIPLGPSCWLVLKLRPAVSARQCNWCWFMFAIQTLPNWLLVYPWSVCKWIELPLLTCAWQHRWDLLQRTISKQVHFPQILSFPLPLVGGGLEGRLKHLKPIFKDWWDDSVVRSTDCSSKGPEFKSQQTRGSSQPSVMGSGAFFWCVWRQLQCTNIQE